LKILSVGAELFHADGQTDSMTKQIGAFHNFANLPLKKRPPWAPMCKQEKIVNWI